MILEPKQPFGEIVASSLDTCTIQAWEWNTYPPYGSLIQIQDHDMTLIGLIVGIVTAPLDGTRMPTAYKKTDSELKAEFPHIFALLRTVLTATIVGGRTNHSDPLMLPIKPAQIHSFSSALDVHNMQTVDLALAIRRIIALHEPHNADSLIQQLILHQKNRAALSGEQLHVYLETYIEMVGNDYKRIFNLNRFVQNI